MRRPKLRAALVAALLGLVFAGTALAGDNAGFTPVEPHSPNAQRITDAYYLILGLTGGVFVIVEGALLLFVFRFRRGRRSRQAEGPQIRGNTSLEIAWTVVPVLILAVIAAFVFYKLPGIEDVPTARAAETLPIRIQAHQYYWEFVYPDGQIAINRMVVPSGRVVRLEVVSADVAHSWWIPALGGKIDAIPGRTNHTWFRTPAEPGVFQGQCAELCGIEHASMRAAVEVVPDAKYRSFLATHSPGSATVGRETFTGVCATCHGLAGEGDIGRALAGNATLNDETAVRLVLKEGLRSGLKLMPAVGSDWPEAQTRAVIAYLQKNLAPAKGVPSGG